jgi:large subunit GTPase 1
MDNILKNSDIKINNVIALPIPRRPKYIEKTEFKEFERLEREAFLNWRRALALEEEKNMTYAITPFEKNIEIWRQLWMVVEKADMLVQIVDGRNPMYFRCDDLETYVKEINPKKETVLLINKADLMSIAVRKHWADYFNEQGITYVFFSAKKESEVILEKDKINMIDLKEEKEEVKEDIAELSDDEEFEPAKNQFDLLDMINNDNDDTIIEDKSVILSENLGKTNQKVTEEVINIQEELNKEVEDDDEEELPVEIEPEETVVEKNIVEEILLTDDLKIMNREQLIKYLKNKVSAIETKTAYGIGFVGFPNVGKSSVINVIMNEKKVRDLVYF